MTLWKKPWVCLLLNSPSTSCFLSLQWQLPIICVWSCWYFHSHLRSCELLNYYLVILQPLPVCRQPMICTVIFLSFSFGTGKYYSTIWETVCYFYSLVQAKRWARIDWTEPNVLDQPKQFLIQKIISKDYLVSIEDPWITVCDVHIYKSSQWCFCYTEVFNRCKSPTAYPPFSFPFPKITVPRERFPSSVRQSNYKTVLLWRSPTLKITWAHVGNHTHSFGFFYGSFE